MRCKLGRSLYLPFITPSYTIMYCVKCLLMLYLSALLSTSTTVANYCSNFGAAAKCIVHLLLEPLVDSFQSTSSSIDSIRLTRLTD